MLMLSSDITEWTEEQISSVAGEMAAYIHSDFLEKLNLADNNGWYTVNIEGTDELENLKIILDLEIGPKSDTYAIFSDGGVIGIGDIYCGDDPLKEILQTFCMQLSNPLLDEFKGVEFDNIKIRRNKGAVFVIVETDKEKFIYRLTILSPHPIIIKTFLVFSKSFKTTYFHGVDRSIRTCFDWGGVNGVDHLTVKYVSKKNHSEFLLETVWLNAFLKTFPAKKLAGDCNGDTVYMFDKEDMGSEQDLYVTVSFHGCSMDV